MSNRIGNVGGMPSAGGINPSDNTQGFAKISSTVAEHQPPKGSTTFLAKSVVNAVLGFTALALKA